jgi:hypothetical protein
MTSACSAFGPDDREHRYDLRLVSDQITTVEYEVEVFADDDGRPVRVVGLFRSDVFPVARKHELNEVATSSPGYLGVKVEGVKIERLVVGGAGGTVTIELQRDGETLRREVLTGAGARVDDLRAGKTF